MVRRDGNWLCKSEYNVSNFTLHTNCLYIVSLATRKSLEDPYHHSALPKRAIIGNWNHLIRMMEFFRGERPTRQRHHQRKTNVMFGGVTAIKRSSNSMPSKYKLIVVRVLNGLYPKFNWTWPRWMMEMMLRIVVMSLSLRYVYTYTSDGGVDGQTDVLTWRQFSDGY